MYVHLFVLCLFVSTNPTPQDQRAAPSGQLGRPALRLPGSRQIQLCHKLGIQILQLISGFSEYPSGADGQKLWLHPTVLHTKVFGYVSSQLLQPISALQIIFASCCSYFFCYFYSYFCVLAEPAFAALTPGLPSLERGTTRRPPPPTSYSFSNHLRDLGQVAPFADSPSLTVTATPSPASSTLSLTPPNLSPASAPSPPPSPERRSGRVRLLCSPSSSGYQTQVGSRHVTIFLCSINSFSYCFLLLHFPTFFSYFLFLLSSPNSFSYFLLILPSPTSFSYSLFLPSYCPNDDEAFYAASDIVTLGR